MLNASIGPGGIEIIVMGTNATKTVELQSDRVELKWVVTVTRETGRGWLQSDRVELK